MTYADFTSGDKISSTTVEGLFNDLDARVAALEGLAFSAYGSTSASDNNMIAASSVATKIVCDTESLDSGSVYNTTDARWTPGVAGTYLIGGVIPLLDSINSTEALYGFVYVNGAEVGLFDFAVAGSATTLCVSGSLPVHADTDDYIELYAKQTSSTARRWQPGTTRTRFFGHLVSAD